MGHLGGGRASHFFHLFRVLGLFGHPWGQNGAKGLIMRPFLSHVRSDLTQKYLQMGPPVGNKAKHLSKFVFLKIGEHFVLFFIIFFPQHKYLSCPFVGPPYCPWPRSPIDNVWCMHITKYCARHMHSVFFWWPNNTCTSLTANDKTLGAQCGRIAPLQSDREQSPRCGGDLMGELITGVSCSQHISQAQLPLALASAG